LVWTTSQLSITLQLNLKISKRSILCMQLVTKVNVRVTQISS
jgi:hypothetical protein